MLTKGDLQAIDNLIEQKLEPIHREVKKIDYLSSQVKKIDSLAHEVKKIDYLSSQVKKIDYLSSQVKKIDPLSREVKKIDYLSSQVKKIDPLSREVKKINANIRKIHRDIKVIIELFDHEYLELRARVERIEEHLHLPPFPSELS